MRYAVLLSFVFVLSACKGQKADSIPATVCGEGQQDSNGHICGQGGLWKPMLGGQCHSHLDCPPPYTHCDSITNLCVIIPSATPIVFATDPIQPGATSDGQYAYNIMAKGYDSLNDWCMSQAQQSSIPGMRNIASWEALIIAPPDTTAGITSPQGVSVNNFFSAPPLVFQSPLSTLTNPINFSSLYPAISDKNGNPTTQASNPTWSAWTGLSSSGYCPALEQQDVLCDYSQPGCDSSCHPKFVEAEIGCTAGSAVVGGIVAATCDFFTCLACTVTNPQIAIGTAIVAGLCDTAANAILTTCHCENIPTQCNQYYGDFETGVKYGPYCDVSTIDSPYPLGVLFGNWGGFSANDLYGIFALTPNSCTGSGPGSDSGFILANDCGGGSYYNSNGSVSKPVLCLSQ